MKHYFKLTYKTELGGIGNDDDAGCSEYHESIFLTRSIAIRTKEILLKSSCIKDVHLYEVEEREI